MSFGGGFGGFGSTNNTSQSTGFGGFGSTANNNTGFGTSQNASTSFGSGNTGGGLFGGGGFGSNNNSPFGANKPGFGSSNTTGGIFGTSNTSTGNTGFGGFGGTNSTSGGFGASSNTGTGLFGNTANKPVGTTFGSSTGGGLFGSSNNTNTFGASQNQGNSLFSSSGTNTTECQGTGGTPFTPFTEKETNSTVTNNFQSISFMQPYSKFSFEELRLADYAQGRRFGNANGQPGAFGQSTFGGFGSSNQTTSTGFGNTSNTGTTGLFGTSNNTSNSTFGTNNQTTGFGGGLFGSQQNKPATSLFGAATSGQSSGTLFGTAGSTGFGTTNITGSFGNTGSSLFGQQNNQQKPAFSFGNANATSSSSTGFGFGATAGSGGGLFGSNNNTQNQASAPSLFGGNQQQQQQNQAGSLFGQQQNQNQNATAFGGGFQTNQQRPSLFGSTGTGTGNSLFGNAQNNQQQNSGTNLFGANNSQNTSNLFGKPAPTGGTSLFGSTNTNATTNPTGSNLFGIGNNNQPQQPSGSIFGTNQQQQQQQQQQQKTSLFGNTTSTTGGLFANNQQNNQGSGLFGQNNQNQSSIFTNSLPGNSQQNSLQQPPGFTASINDPTPYGSASIFNGLPPPPQYNPGPIATPISAGQKQRKPAALPQYKINPAMASRLVTPRKPPQGYGFSYSTYGSPSSVSSVSSTPGGLSNSLLGNSLSRNLGKSLSLSNLRRTFDSDSDSILSPGAFSPSSSRYSGGSLKKLTIDRSLRSDLFGSQTIAALPSPERNDLPRTPSILKKKVSFDAGIAGGENGTNGLANGSTDESATPSAQEQGYLRPSNSKRTNGGNSSLISDQPEMQQTTGKELAIVPEDGSPEAARGSRTNEQNLEDPVPGAYWTKPALEELKKMTPSQLKSVSGFVIGREGCGQCQFDHPVDLSNLNLDELFGKYAIITIRSITIYPTDVSKPPVGMGMNVPSTLTLENSWPRKRNNRTPVKEKSGPRLAKHVDRLSRGTNTEFVNYDAETGYWTFKVPHFTTYGLDYDDDDIDELSEGDVFQSSVLSEIPPTPTPKSRAPRSRSSPLAKRLNGQDSSIITSDQTHASSMPEDTFEFKTGRRFPGAFDDTPVFELDQEMEEVEQDNEHFLEERSVSSLSASEDEPSELEEFTPVQHTVVQDDEIDLIGSFPTGDPEETFPKSILKTHHQSTSLGTPGRTFFGIENDWTEQLQRTISPKKQDREALRQSQALLFRDLGDVEKETPAHAGPLQDSGNEFATSIDLMNSLFGKEQARKSKSVKQTETKGFKWPYPKSSNSDANNMCREDRAFHNSFKPTWGPKSVLLYASDEIEDVWQIEKSTDNSNGAELESRDLRFSFFKANPDITEPNFRKQRDQAAISIETVAPIAKAVPWNFETGTKYHSSIDANSHERLIWELASILFDEHYDETPTDISDDVKIKYQNRVKKDRLAAFWARLCREEATLAVAAAVSAEERAIAFLSMNKVAEACNALIEGKNYRLATLVAQIGGNQTMHDDIAAQIDDWRKLNVLSEISDPIRALYELLAGNTCTAVGKKGPLEDRSKSFIISERFNMSWKRAFGLKLWYSILADDPLEAAVQGYLTDLSDYDIKRPTPWFLTSDLINPSWDDPYAMEREDVLWGLLKLYSDQSGTTGTLSEVVGPENVNDNPLSTRLSFELYHTLSTHFPHHVSSEGGDQLTLAFATELNSVNQWLWALFVLLRLSDASQRQRALKSLLAEHAGDINDRDESQLNFIFEDLKIPQQWVWEAKALYSRAVSKDYVAETRFLLKAENWNEAHNTLCTVVAPQAIIERSYTTLQSLLDGFNHKPSTWRTGGGVYSDYLQLVQNRAGSEEGALLGRLVRVLGEMHSHNKTGNATAGHGAFLKKVAVQDMSAVVGDKVLAGAGGDAKEQAWVLQLPLTGETRRARTAELSWGYYRKLMAACS